MPAAVLRFDAGLMRSVVARGERPLAVPAPEASEIERLRSREPGAWRLLFEREHAAIYSYAFSRVAATADAEDLAAEVFAHAWRSAATLEDRGLPPRAWLFGIARNVVAEQRRRRFRQPPMLDLAAFDGSADGTQAATDQLALARAVASLPRTDGEVVTLRFLHGLSLQETSEALGLTVDAVKARQARALQRLRGLLGEGG